MRCIGSLPDATQAQRFGDFLVAEGVRNQVEENNAGRWDIWVLDDDQLEEARRELARFEAEPAAARYDGVDAEARRIRAEEEKRSQRLRRNFTDVRTQWARPAGLPVVTVVVLVLAVIVGVGTKLGMDDTPLLNWLLFSPYTQSGTLPENGGDGGRSLITGGDTWFLGESMFGAIKRGQVWRLVTPALIHFGALHLVFNLFWLMRFGQMIETRKGAVFFALLVLAGAIVGNLAEALWTELDWFQNRGGYAAFGGLSGVNYALFGYAWLTGRLRPHEQIGTDTQTAIILFAWLVLCMTGAMGPVANTAHLAGLLVGLAVAWIAAKLARIKFRAR